MSGVRSSPGFWALAMGAAGGAAGFFGPIILNPEANQGPMLGLFITGPGGALAGAVLGFIFRILPFTDLFRTQALTLFCTLLGVGTLWFALPEPREMVRVVDATIGSCRPARELMPARIAHWEERIAAVNWSPARDNWRADTERMLREYSGVVVELDVARSNVILEHRMPWNKGRLTAVGWKRVAAARAYFGGGSCESYPRGKRVLLAPTPIYRNAWPPDDLPNFLGVLVLEPVPANYQRLL
jgi:hypothetical protein